MVEDPPVGVVELVTQGVDALCVIAPRASSLDLLRQQSTGLPTLVIKAESDPEMHTAAVDQRAGAMAAVMHLIELGHRSIAHLSGPLDWYDARAREQGWRDALADAGLPIAPPVVGDWTSDYGYTFGKTYDFADAAAVFAANDQMALGLVHGLSERGLKVPDDLAVVGYDDIEYAAAAAVPLTSVRQPREQLGRTAAQLLLSENDPGHEHRHVRFQPELVVRASTRTQR